LLYRVDRGGQGDEQVKLSISEAARRAGVERPTLYRKLKSGALSKGIGDDGKPCIDLSELARLYPHVTNSHDTPKPVRMDSLLQAELQAAQFRILDLEADKADLRAERDRLLQVLETQAEQIKLLAPPPARSKPWWHFWN
jgi:transposase-like protein